MASCRELASDIPAITEFQHQLWLLEHKTSTLSILFPQLPLPAKRAKETSIKYLFTTLWNYIEERKKAPVPSSNTIDLLLGQGLKNEDIIQFMLAFIFAGVINTGINGTQTSYLLLLTLSTSNFRTHSQPAGFSSTSPSTLNGKPPSTPKSPPSSLNTATPPTHSTNGSPQSPSPSGRTQHPPSILPSARPFVSQ
jgi:hypothetical protein